MTVPRLACRSLLLASFRTRRHSPSGSAHRGRIRTFLNFELAIKVDCSRKPAPGEKRHRFSWEGPPADSARQFVVGRAERNPCTSRKWRASMDRRGEPRAGLARRLGVSRARVTQVLQILDWG